MRKPLSYSLHTHTHTRTHAESLTERAAYSQNKPKSYHQLLLSLSLLNSLSPPHLQTPKQQKAMSPGPVVEAAEPETLLQIPITDEPQKKPELQVSHSLLLRLYISLSFSGSFCFLGFVLVFEFCVSVCVFFWQNEDEVVVEDVKDDDKDEDDDDEDDDDDDDDDKEDGAQGFLLFHFLFLYGFSLFVWFYHMHL